MSFKDEQARDMQNVFLNSDEFAEDVLYTPAGGTARTIKAIVDRKPAAPSNMDGARSLVRTVEITVARHATAGVEVVTKNEDKFTFPFVIGGADVDFVVTDIVEEDDVSLKLQLQK